MLLLFGISSLASIALAQINPELVGTWTTKSGKVLTGPSFYDPVNDRLFEPDLTGISYSFTADGHYEEAFYRALSNPTTPTCPSGLLQWQHGTVTETANNTLILIPIPVDGRQLLSQPCNYKTAALTRYNQSELFTKYEVLTDTYNGRQRLNLYQWDGTPSNPMWLAYRPPVMLPTVTLNPTRSADASATRGAAATAGSKVRRLADGAGRGDWEGLEVLDRRAPGGWKSGGADRWFWVGVGMTGFGAFLYLCF